MINKFKKILPINFFLDWICLLQFFLVSISFLDYYKYVIPFLSVSFLVHIYKLKKTSLNFEAVLGSYFSLLVYSLVFFRSIHTMILALNLLLNIFYFIKRRKKELVFLKLEILTVIFFCIIFLNQILFPPFLKSFDTFLFFIFYPVLFYFLKKNAVKIDVQKSKIVFILSVIVTVISLFFIGFIKNKLSFPTNTFFAETLDLTHVYYGLFLGVAICFLLLIDIKTNYVKYKYLLIFLFFLLLIYTGARMALLTVLLIIFIHFFNKSKLNFYLKVFMPASMLFIFLYFSFNYIPRFKNDILFVKKVYTSVKNNDKEDIILNSWRNIYQRFLVTKYTVNEIKENFFLGIGIQNVKDVVTEKIHKDGYQYFEPLNPHNQYLHYLLGIGLFGFIYFFYYLIAIIKLTSQNYYFLLFFVIVMITESILVRIKGISLFLFFSHVLSYKLFTKND